MNIQNASQALYRQRGAGISSPRPLRDIILLGASAGGVDALRSLVRCLPHDLPAAVFVVLHLRRDRETFLPGILSRAGHLPARAAEDGEPLRPGRIYIAPPNRQLVLDGDHVRLRPGERAERWCPSVDALFQSAAEQHGPRVAAAILTGYLNDGAAGLALVKAEGGATIVQDPHDALAGDMPRNALRAVQADYTLPLAAIPPVLSWLTGHGSQVAAAGSQFGMGYRPWG